MCDLRSQKPRLECSYHHAASNQGSKRSDRSCSRRSDAETQHHRGESNLAGTDLGEDRHEWPKDDESGVVGAEYDVVLIALQMCVLEQTRRRCISQVAAI